MVPGAVLQGDREDVRDGVVQCFAAGRGAVLLRIVGAGADHEVGVVAGLDQHGLHVGRVGDLRVPAVELARQVDPRLRLVLGRVLLGVGVHDGALGFAGGRQRHGVGGIGAVQHPGDDAVLALVDRHGGGLAAHGPVRGLDGHLAGKRRGVGLPGGDLALAGLPGGGGGVQGLADGLEDGLDIESQQRADAGGGGGAEVRNVVNLVLVQADGLDQVDLDLVAGGDAADQVLAAGAHVLGHGEDRRDVVARVGVFRRQEGVVVVELTNSDAVGPGSPLGGHTLFDAEDLRALAAGGGAMGQGLRAGCDDRCAVQRGNRHRGVVDHPVDHHVGDLVGDGDGIGGHLRNLEGELVLAGQVFLALVNADVVFLDHGSPSIAYCGV